MQGGGESGKEKPIGKKGKSEKEGRRESHTLTLRPVKAGLFL